MRSLVFIGALSLASPAAAQEWHPGWLHAAIGASMVAHATDLSTTAYFAGKLGPRFREANPLLRPVAGNPVRLAIVKTSIAVAINYGLLRLHRTRPRLALALTLAETAAIGAVAYQNTRRLGG